MLLNIVRLIRLPNLLIIALTLYFTRYFLLRPMIEINGWNIKLSNFHFLLLNLSVILIAAGGYIINDYFDTKIDAINKPYKVVVGKGITRRSAMLSHIILSTLGVALGAYISFKVGLPKLALIHVMATGLLWFYSTDFKKMVLIGNIVIALLSGIIPLIAALYEPNNIYVTWRFVFGYCIFAFIVSLIREIIKDMEDAEGDAAENCKTLPILLGIQPAKYIVIALSLITIAGLAYIQYGQLLSKDYISFWYFSLAIQIPLFALIIQLLLARYPKHYNFASTLSKIILLAGVLSMYVFYYSFLA